MIFPSAKLKDVRKSFLKIARENYEQKEAENLFRILGEEYLGMSSGEIILSGDKTLSSEEIAAIENAMDQLRNDVPVQYITGNTYFYGSKFRINQGVLIPRPETEELADWIVKEYQMSTRSDQILDIGTGCGCIAITIKLSFPHAQVWAIDQSSEAIENTDLNARLMDADLDLARLDILERLQWGSLGMFHLIVSNPPYVRESEKTGMKANVLNHEPPGALFVPDEDPLMYYRNILMFSKNHLIRKGWVYFEINEAMGESVIKLMEENGFSEIDLRKDMKGKDRLIRGKLKN